MQIFILKHCLKSVFKLFIYVNPSNLTKYAFIFKPKCRLFGITGSKSRQNKVYLSEKLVFALDISTFRNDKSVCACFSFAGLISTCLIHHLFILGNKKVKLEIANGSQRSLSSLILIVCLYGCIPFIFSSHPNQELSMESKALDLPDLKCCHILCDIALRDVIIKCSTVALKASVAAIPAGWLRYESRGEWYLLLEAISQMYRSVAPIQPWLNILSIYAKEYEYFAVIVYIIIKGMMLYPALRLLVVALWILLRNQGICMMANPDQVQNAGSSCSVCRSAYVEPLCLPCGHIFCKICICKWYKGHETCPNCRALIKNFNGQWIDGSTASFFKNF
ncbi:RING finger and transmembrane domain-containing protein 2-like isoform X2 [Zootermopsis nevadensis]|uniref:RING finger and transmembrane domain-containing protein 2-like isoform X2 n=1 Tax=Zootermopsis nevadensis TaxID=136037 RepID=UPI000B8E8075|nr:RING finger and transmembrane domain-containing protein 2-like isoform X2 [Zootermopsis nevadensis]